MDPHRSRHSTQCRRPTNRHVQLGVFRLIHKVHVIARLVAVSRVEQLVVPEILEGGGNHVVVQGVPGRRQDVPHLVGTQARGLKQSPASEDTHDEAVGDGELVDGLRGP